MLEGRQAVEAILRGDDDRVIVVVGCEADHPWQTGTRSPCGIRPCSVNNPDSALEYARKLQSYAEAAKEDLLIIMRVYFEKYVT